MRKLKATLAGFVLATGSMAASAANGPLDGLYQCTAASITVFATVVGQPNGQSLYAIAALAPTNDLYGFGIGNATPTAFTGTTSFGLPFNLNVGNNGSIGGTMGIVTPNGPVQAPVTCAKLF